MYPAKQFPPMPNLRGLSAMGRLERSGFGDGQEGSPQELGQRLGVAAKGLVVQIIVRIRWLSCLPNNPKPLVGNHASRINALEASDSFRPSHGSAFGLQRFGQESYRPKEYP
jgi:hypothetical protein